MVVGAGDREIKATAVGSVKDYVHTLRPLAEWTDFDSGSGPYYIHTDLWLMNIRPLLNRYKARSAELLSKVVLAPQLFVTREQLVAFLTDARQDTYFVWPEVTSNLMNFCWFRSECNRSCSFCFF